MSRLLDQFESDGALKGPLFASLAARLNDRSAELLPGHRVGAYRIVRLLGRGGMAAVYLAERADGEFEQSVALKIVASDTADAERRDILRRERQILARLQHPHIARLLDGGSTDDGLLWFALEPVDGERIDRYCISQRLSIDACVRLFLGVCDAVGFAHSQLLVHRDIKPSNVLVTATGDVKLLDFGIAGLLAADEGSSEAPHALSPGFASPEQLQGAMIGTASDIWQLGRVLAGMLDAAREATGKDWRDHTDLASIIAKATRANASERYRTVAEFAADLTCYLERRPVKARDGGMLYHTRRFLQRRRFAVAITVIAALSFAAVVGHFTWRVTQERNNALHEASRANAATQFLLRLFEVADPSVNRGDRLTANEVLDRGIARLRNDLSDQPELRVVLLEKIATVHMTLGQYDRAINMLNEAVALSRTQPNIKPAALALRLRELARSKSAQNDFVGALAAAEEAEALLSDSAEDAEVRVRLLNTQAVIQLRLGAYEQALAIETKAIDLAKAQLKTDHQLVAYALNNRGTAYRGMHREQEAYTAYEEAYRIIRVSSGENHPDTYQIAGTYAQQLARINRGDEAMQLARAVHIGIEHLFEAKGLRVAESRVKLADTALAAGHDQLALELAQVSLAELRTIAGADALDTAHAANTVGNALLKLKRPADAISPLRDVVRIQKLKFAEDNILLTDTRVALASALCDSGQFSEGMQLLNTANANYAGISFAHTRIAQARAVQANCRSPNRDSTHRPS
jgi:eukaryotic-like serine/threonine-protein kinase